MPRETSRSSVRSRRPRSRAGLGAGGLPIIAGSDRIAAWDQGPIAIPYAFPQHPAKLEPRSPTRLAGIRHPSFLHVAGFFTLDGQPSHARHARGSESKTSLSRIRTVYTIELSKTVKLAFAFSVIQRRQRMVRRAHITSCKTALKMPIAARGQNTQRSCSQKSMAFLPWIASYNARLK